MQDIALLKALATKNHYQQYHAFVNKDALPDETKRMLEMYEKYFDKYESDTTTDDFLSYFSNVYATNLNKEKITYYLSVIHNIRAYQNEVLVNEILDKYKLKVMAEHIVGLANQVMDGSSDIELDDFIEVIDQHKKEINYINHQEKARIASDLDSVVAMDKQKPGYKWSLDCLNVGCGPAVGGDLIEVFARPNTGKTSFVVNETVHFANQIKGNKQIVWFNNEESGNKIIKRYYSNVLSKPWQVIKSANQELLDSFKEQFKNKCLPPERLVMYDMPAVHTGQVNSILASLQPAVVVFNNLDKVHGFKDAGTEAQRLAKLYQWARELGKEHDAVIFAIGQASADAEQRKKLRMDDMDSSKTGKAGEADLIIGIGYDSNEPNTRYICTPKNKLDGGTGDREVFQAVDFNGAYAQFKEEVRETYGR